MGALLLIGAQAFAQDDKEVVLIPANTGLSDGMVYEGTNVKFTLGNDGQWPDASADATAFSAGSANADFKQDYVDKDGKDKNGIVYFSGKNNPKDGPLNGTASSGGSYSPDKKNNPASGTYYIVEAQKAGSVRACIYLNAAKSLYVTKSDGTMLDPDNGEFTLTDGNGSAVELGVNVDGKGNEIHYSVAEKVSGGLINFKAEAGEKYYIFCTGSKLGFVGVEFTPSGEQPQGEIRGDLNGDGVVTITDVMILVNIVLGKNV